MQEFILRRYAAAEFIYKMDASDFISFLIRAKEIENDEHIRAQWVAMLPYMSMQQLKFISYEQYKEQCLGKNIDNRSADEIIAELEQLHGCKLV